MTFLELHSDDANPVRFGIEKQRTTIGRRKSCAVRLTDNAVSLVHAQIIFTMGEPFLEDLRSKNGTRLNGDTVLRQRLNDGDMIEIGNHRLRFRIEPEPADDAASDPAHAATARADSEPVASDTRSPLLVVLPNAQAEREFLNNRSLLDELGCEGTQIMAIVSRPYGHLLTHIAGEHEISVNGKIVAGQSYPLYVGDVIELGGLAFRFGNHSVEEAQSGKEG
jgi:pSer/pThr/pTyr-binding forkhead associated (FHA) protein